MAAAGFSLKQGLASDLHEIIDLALFAIGKNPSEIYTPENTPRADLHSLYYALFGVRYNMADCDCFKIVEDATGRIVAYTALQYPWFIRPMPAALKIALQDHSIPKLPEGPKPDGWAGFLEVLALLEKFDYDPEKDFHRKGTNVLPAFQKMGFGTLLTKHCNDISDKAKLRTFLPAASTSVGMFRKLGFRDLLEGEDLSTANVFPLCREPKGLDS